MTTELIQLTNQPKTDAAVTATSVAPSAESGTSVTRDVAPRPTPQNTESAGRRARWILSVIIVAPLINIAMHVVQPKLVGFL